MIDHLFCQFQVSNVSTRAVVSWDQNSAASHSRRSTAGNGGNSQQDAGSRIGQHLNRLHKKALQQQHNQPSLQGGRTENQQSCPTTPGGENQQNPVEAVGNFGGFGGRRASDPVRVLDRNFGARGQQMTRHRSGSYAGHQQTYQVIDQRISTCQKMALRALYMINLNRLDHG